MKGGKEKWNKRKERSEKLLSNEDEKKKKNHSLSTEDEKKERERDCVCGGVCVGECGCVYV